MPLSGANQAAVDLARALLARYIQAEGQRGKLNGRTSFGVTPDEVVASLGARAEAPGDFAARDVQMTRAEVAFDVALAATPEPPIARLARVFSLEMLDLEIVALLLAPELDHDLERVLSYALDDFTRKRPDIGFVARVLGNDDAVLRCFDDGSPLRRHGVVTIGPQAPEASKLMRSVRVADRIVGFLRGNDSADELVHGLVKIGGRPIAPADVVMNPEIVTRVGRALESRGGPPRVLLAGPEGAGRSLVVEALMGSVGRTCVKIDLGGIVAEGRIEERVAAALREAALRDSVAIFDGGSTIDKEVPRALIQAIEDGISDLDVPIVFALSGHPTWLVSAVPSLVELDIPPPTFRERLELWGRALPPPLATEEQLETVASRYAFTGGVIQRAASRAASSARLRDPDAPAVTLDDLGDAARLMFSHRLGSMAQRIPTGFSWDDLVLPKDTMDALKEVVRFGRHRAYLLEEWGFAKKLPYGRGMSAILAGPPGTGKTMVAQLLARELGYDLYRIDLSQVVNKYIGETEKNLARIFDEAESSHAVLFFDEADSLFAKRTEVKSSNDRYANLEVNYLLQRMETYDGVTLLATNLEQGLDEAFKRRVRFSVQFELPEEPERALLWRSMFPPAVPLAPDIDWELMARKFEMAGGYIKKAALRAALIAVEAKRAVTNADLMEAARLEYREMGRVI
jgi:SpoVK/Ycf46/Vps4 family AAA+-type ATPase